MALAKLTAVYQCHLGVEAFEKASLEEHARLAMAKLAEKTKIVATKIPGSWQSAPRSIESPGPERRNTGNRLATGHALIATALFENERR